MQVSDQVKIVFKKLVTILQHLSIRQVPIYNICIKRFLVFLMSLLDVQSIQQSHNATDLQHFKM